MTRRLCVLLIALCALPVTFAPAAAGGSCHPDVNSKMRVDTDGKVTIAECAFVDTVTYVDPGDSVTWTSKDVYPHTVTGAAYAWGDEDMLESGGRVTYTFEDEGVFPYFCALHPSMVGAVVVGDPAAGEPGGTAGVEKVDLAAAAAPDEAPPAGGDGAGLTAATGMWIVAAGLGLALTVRLALRRRAGATPAA